MSNAIHAYISQSDKGELVIGAGTDAYTSYTQRGALHVNMHTLAAICELFPAFRRLRMLRNWGGIVDVSPDRSPIIGKTSVPGLFINCGWGTGGFKATPGSAHLFAWTMAHDQPHPINAPFTLERFREGLLIDEAAAAAMSAWRAERGGHVDRSRPIGFSFDGRPYRGLAGDTLASALLANGVHLLGRSFKYHRPRGLLSAGSEEPNALVTVARDAARSAPNLRATQVEIYEGLRAHSQNRWPSLAWDFGSLSNGLAPLFPAGFYYKTFMCPRFAWHRWYEPRIRAAAGLGRAPIGADPDGYAQRYAHCDVLVVGAGAAGLAAATPARRSAARLLLFAEHAG